jgi:phosphonate transport system substrate-binding protein
MDMTINRRMLITGLAAAAAATKVAWAQSWRGQYPELVYAVVPAENATGVTDRFAPFVDYLSRELGTKVTLRVANDYAAVIEGQRAGNIHIGYYGPASFSRARLTGVATDAFVIDVNSDGSKGYYSVFYVLTKSPYQKIEDLKGKNLGLVDPNSTSGYNMPLYTLDKLGISPDTFFGSPMKKEDFRIILKSELIINSPTAMLANLPAELQAAIRTTFLESAAKDKAAFARLSDGKNQPFQPIDNAAYDDTIRLIQFPDRLRKKSS